MEVAVPLKNLNGRKPISPGSKWGINICRSIPKPPHKKERFNTMSRLVVGQFKQPDMFARMFFTEGDKRPAAKNEHNILKNGSFEAWKDAMTPANWKPTFWGEARVAKDSAVVHSGNHSVRLDTGKKTAIIHLSILPPESAQSKGFKYAIPDGKYTLAFYWYSTTGRASISIKLRDVANKKWHHYDINKRTWITTTKPNQYQRLQGKKNSWNRTVIPFKLDFPRSWGQIVFNGGSGKPSSLFIDDVTLVKND